MFFMEKKMANSVNQAGKGLRMMTVNQCAARFGASEEEVLQKCCVVDVDGELLVPAEESERLG